MTEHEDSDAVPDAVGTDCYNGAITGDVAATMGTPGSSVNASGPTVMQPVVAPPLTASNDPSRSPQSAEVTAQVAAVVAAQDPIHFRKSRRAQSVTDHETWVEDGVSNTLNTFDVGDIRATDVVAQPVCGDSRYWCRACGGAFADPHAAGVGGLAPAECPRCGEERAVDEVRGYRMVAFGEYADDNTASSMKARDFKDATDLAVVPAGDAVEQSVAFTQNQREEVRVLEIASALSAESGSHQQTYIASPLAFKVRGGCEGGGKGYLGSEDVAFTISTTHDQDIAIPVEPIPIHDQATRFSGKRGDKQDGKGNGLGVGAEGDPSPTLTKGDKHAVAIPMINMQGSKSMAVAQEDGPSYTLNAMHGHDVHAIGVPEVFRDPSPTLTSKMQGSSGWAPHNEDAHLVGWSQEVADPVTANEGRTYTHEGSNNFRTRNVQVVDQPIAFKPGQSAGARSLGAQVDIACTLEGGGGGNNRQAIAQPVATVYERHDQDARVKEVSVSPTLHSKSDNMCDLPMVMQPVESEVKQVQWASGGGKLENDTAQALRSNAEHSYQFARLGMQVRRLTPTECERLQGFPDDFTNIPWRGKPEAPDSGRYKALGNSMAVPCMAWLGKRIDDHLKEGK